MKTANPPRSGDSQQMRIGTAEEGPGPGRIAVKAQQAQAVPASRRPRSLAPFDLPSPPLSSTAAERGGAELAGALEGVGVEALASQLSKSPAPVSRPPEFDPDLDPSAALLLRVSAAGSATELRPTAPSSRPARREDGAVHAALLPVGGEDVTHTQEENH